MVLLVVAILKGPGVIKVALTSDQRPHTPFNRPDNPYNSCPGGWGEKWSFGKVIAPGIALSSTKPTRVRLLIWEERKGYKNGFKF